MVRRLWSRRVEGKVAARAVGSVTVQFLESSILGLRAARSTWRRPGAGLDVTLFPMTHAADARFYDQVWADAFAHDVALVEGVASPVVGRITRVYRWSAGGRLGLKVQPRWPTAADGYPARIVHADITGTEFDRAWCEIPGATRLALGAGAMALGLWWRLSLSRERLVPLLACDDLPRREALMSWSPETAALDAAILDLRDRRLVERLGDEIDAAGREARRIAAVYGAANVAAAGGLRRRGFAIVESAWRDAIAL